MFAIYEILCKNIRMSTINRGQQTRLSRALKEFAFSESPQFADATVRAMDVIRVFEIDGEHGETSIEIGMRAVQYALDDGDTAYSFHLHRQTMYQVEPTELQLPEEDWYQIACLYDAEDEIDDDDEETAIDSNDLKVMLDDEGAICERYERQDYAYDDDGVLRFSDECGYRVAGKYYGVSETHPVDIDYSSLPDTSDLTEESTGDEIVTKLLFDESTAELREEFAESGDIMPANEKTKEIRFLLKCLRKRQITL